MRYSSVGSSLCTSFFLFNGEWILIPDGNADAAHYNAAGKPSEVYGNSSPDSRGIQRRHRADRSHARTHRCLQRQRNVAGHHVSHLALLALSLLQTIWAIRAARIILQTVPGELVGPVPMILTSVACLSLFCLLSGGLFVVAIRMCEAECAVSDRKSTRLNSSHLAI